MEWTILVVTDQETGEVKGYAALDEANYRNWVFNNVAASKWEDLASSQLIQYLDEKQTIYKIPGSEQ